MQKKKLRILFNDAHSNLPWQKEAPQGGPSRFARVFSKYFANQKHIELLSLLFTHNTEDDRIFWRRRKLDRIFYELVYPRELLTEHYTRQYKKKDFLKKLEPWLYQLEEVLSDSAPDIVFLNGFNLSNWMLMESAHRLKIPTVIQHAGIWKKEIEISQKHFSKSVKRIFNSLEKEIAHKTNHQIFLNDFSRSIFLKEHGIKRSANFLNRSSIIGLPIEKTPKIKMHFAPKNKISIGVIARWDSVKNHASILRLAKYSRKSGLNWDINVVTRLPDGKVSDFKKEYEKLVNIVSPMQIRELNRFIAKQDILLIPSRFDVSPTVFLEGLTCGKPVLVSTNVGWANLLIEYGMKNLLFKPSASGKAMAEIILSLIEKKSEYLKRFDYLQKHLLEKHDVNKVMAEYRILLTKQSHVGKK